MATLALPADLPKTMRAVRQPDIHSKHLVMTSSGLPTPKHPDDVLIRVAAAAPCAGELLWAMNFPSLIPADKDQIPCQDLAGTVIAAPADSKPLFKPGDEVYCRIDAGRAGSAAEYTIARVSELALRPKNLSWAETAATPLSALTAWQALFVQGTLNAAGIHGDAEARAANGRQRVLVTGAAGGVGSWVVQFASLAGAGAIVGLVGPDKIEAVKALGATEAVDYKQKTVEAWAAEDAAGREVDLVVDLIGGPTLAGCWRAIKTGGTLLSINTPPDMVKPADVSNTPAKAAFFIVEPLGSNLAQITDLVEAGKVKPVVDSVYEFDEFDKAFERLESGHAKGKIVIKVAEGI